MKKVIILFLCAVVMFGTVIGVNRITRKIPTDIENDVYLTVVNKNHKLPDDWLEKIELLPSRDAWGDEVLIERNTLEHFEEMRAYLFALYGIDIRLDSVYRSVADQEQLWKDFEKKYGEDYCRSYVAVPGYSEHHTGLAVDICLVKDGQIISDNDEMIAEKEIFDKIHQHLADYGFILRYPVGKEDITGYAYEPWHFRFVGEAPAINMGEYNLTLEEFMETN